MVIVRCCVDNVFKTKTDGFFGKGVVYGKSGGDEMVVVVVVANAVSTRRKNNIDDEKPQLSIWRLKDEVPTLFQEV